MYAGGGVAATQFTRQTVYADGWAHLHSSRQTVYVTGLPGRVGGRQGRDRGEVGHLVTGGWAAPCYTVSFVNCVRPFAPPFPPPLRSTLGALPLASCDRGRAGAPCGGQHPPGVAQSRLGACGVCLKDAPAPWCAHQSGGRAKGLTGARWYIQSAAALQKGTRGNPCQTRPGDWQRTREKTPWRIEGKDSSSKKQEEDINYIAKRKIIHRLVESVYPNFGSGCSL